MGALSDLFKFATTKQVSNSEIPEIFPLPVVKSIFIESDIFSTYLKILTDVIERTNGLDEDQQAALWDNCLQNEANEGLLSLLAKAMTDRSDLFLVYSPSVKVLRKATHEEQEKIRADYKAKGESPLGVYISFKRYKKTEMLQIYSAFEYCVLSSLNKTLNISKAVQIKIEGLRSSVSVTDSSVAIAQMQSIAEALRKGCDVGLDKNDTIETANPDTSSTEKAITFLDAKRAFILDLPIAYITGTQTGGIGSTGENDMRAVERGLKQYFVSIIKPVLKALFDVDVKFKSQDSRQTTSALELIKTFELVSEDYLSRETKQRMVATAFDLDAEEELKLIEENAKEREENTPDFTPNDNDSDNEDDNEGEKEQ